MKTKLTPIVLMAILLLNGLVSTIAQKQYNVLFIAVDDMNDKSPLFGNTQVIAPNLQRLASHGILFNMAYCQFPLCNPSRTSLLSGWRPDKTRVKGNDVRPRSLLGPNMVFLPEYFRQKGYHTERYGKILHGRFENDITWDYSEPPEKNDNSGFNNIPDSNSDATGLWFVKNVADTALEDNGRVRHLISSMQQSHSQPFFYGLGLIGTHVAFSPNLSYWNMIGDSTMQQLLPTNDKGEIADLKGNGSSNILLPNTPENDRADVPAIAFERQIVMDDSSWKNAVHAYYSDVTELDTQLGMVLDEMDRQQLWQNTVVIFWSDHGQHLGEHEGEWLKNTLFEESLHVPLIVCAPGKTPGVCSNLVELVDIYPTLAELCGLPVPEGLEGTSFAPLIDNPAFKWKTAVFSQVSHTNKDLGRSITTLLNRYNSWGHEGEELYDHESDPKEYNNLASNPDDSGTVKKLKSILSGGWKKALPPVYTKSTWYPDADSDGYGSTTDSIRSYWLVKGYAQNNADCNDHDASVYPGAPEICDGKDNNCNGLIDEDCLPQISVNSNTTKEGNSGTKNMVFTITLSQPSNETIKVRFNTADSTATHGDDYVAVSSIVSIAPGKTSKKISVPIIGDNIPEQNELFKIYLDKPKNAFILAGSGVGQILDDDIAATPQDAQDQAPAFIKKQSGKPALLWPNPATDHLNIQFENLNTSAIKIKLINMPGVKLKTWNYLQQVSPLIQLDLSSIPNGAYFLLITDDKGKEQAAKIIIAH